MPLITYTDIFDDLPLRLKTGINPYVEKLIQAQKEGSLPLKFGGELRGMKGNWREYFSSRMGTSVDKLILEIGVHKGKVLNKLVQDHPNSGIIGMDITMKRVVLSAERIKRQSLKNGVVLLGNARAIDDIFDKDELDGIIIFFPDPWTKKVKQMGNRLINKEFCQKVARTLCKNGFFWLKTDSLNYFEETAEHFSQLGFTPMDSPPFKETYESTFEARFKSMGYETYGNVFIKP